MDDVWVRVGSQLLARVSGPMKFRIVLQPCMAAFFAIRAGLADARTAMAPYFWGLLSDTAERDAMTKDGWKSIGRVFLLALVLDAVYQVIGNRAFWEACVSEHPGLRRRRQGIHGIRHQQHG